jgi:hypothetical protein
LESELATLRTAKAQATAQAGTPNTSGPFANRADCERAYCSIQGEGLALAKAKAEFRKVNARVLGL